MATIIKSDASIEAPAGEAVRPAVYTLSNMATQGDAYVQAVREEAAKIVQQANADAAKVRKQAENEGRRAATASVSEMIDQRIAEQMQTLKPALDSAVEQIHENRGEWIDHWDRAVIHLATAIAERIVRRELRDAPEISYRWVREALELASGAAEVTVALHPEDHKQIERQVGPLVESIGRVAEARFVADETITRGGCRVDTQHGSIDQQIETQLQRIAEEIG